MLCFYGCGREAQFEPKKGRPNWCCEDNYRKCPENRKKYGSPGEKNGMFGKHHSKESIIKLTKARKTTGFRYTIHDWKSKHPLFFKIEKMRKNPNNPLEIQVTCKKCNKWFTPTGSQMAERLKAIEKPYGQEENNFYCSDKCKSSCELYRRKACEILNISKEISYTNEEYNIWRQEVLSRAENKCEYCGKTAQHCHHIKPKKLEPFFTLDPDYGVAVCKKCHYNYGHIDECSTGSLASKVCI